MVAEAKIVFSGDASGAVAAANKAGAAYKRLSTQINEMQSLASKALSFVGLSVSAAEIIKMADNYGQLTSRLQLVTRYTGDFTAVQAALNKAADETRASLAATTDMYTKMSPTLQALGKNGVQSVGIVTTINKAIALSGVSAEQASAGIMQFSQALGSGRLNGDELNSILENTPGLADAIAEGLGVARGALKKMGEEGALTSDVLITALEKVAPRVSADFEKLPLTVGQSLTKLNNNLVEIVGGGAQATGAMGALARAIVFVSDGIKSLSDSGSLKALFVGVAEAADGFSRVVRVSGKYIAAWAADISTGTRNSRAIWQAFYDDVEGIANEALQRDKDSPAIVASAQDKAARRLDIERQLQVKLDDLAKNRLISEGKVSADILKTDAATTAERIKNAERLREAFSRAQKANEKSAEDASKEAGQLREKKTEVKQTTADRAAEARRGAMTPDEQQANIRRTYEEAAGKAEFAATNALTAAVNGRMQNAAKFSAEAEKAAERASSLAEKFSDPEEKAKAIERVGAAQDNTLEAQTRVKDSEAGQYAQQAENEKARVSELDTMITELQTKAAAIQVGADITAAQGAIATLQSELDKLQDKTITVTVVQAGSVPANADTTIPAQAGGGYARGGWTGPGGKWQPAGIVHADEFVIRQEVVRQRGAKELLARLNAGGMAALNLRGYASGGLVRNLATPSLNPRSAAGSSAGGTPITLVLDSHQVPVTATQDVANQLKTMFAREALRRGGRR